MSPDVLNRIHHGDCVAGMNALPAGTVDLAFADPPFNIGYKYDEYDDRREREHYLDWSEQWMRAVHRVLKPGGTFWLAIGDEYAAELKLGAQQIGFTCRSWVVWYYTFGVNCVNKFTRSHAHLFYFVKDAKSFTFRADDPANRIPSARQLVYNDARANPRGRLPDDTWILRPQDLSDCFTAEEDTWYFPRVAGTFKERAGFHGCQMPEQLLGRIIRTCSHEGDVVLDPFSGSATTLVTAKKLGRQYLGFELSTDYARRGAERLAAAQVGEPLVGSADPTRSAPATPTSNDEPTAVEVRCELISPAAATSPEAAAPAIVEAPQVVEAAEAEPAPPVDPHAPLVEAFRRACGGYSLDRVVADPKLQTALVEHCRELRVPGDLHAWNAALLRLRKAGKLTSVPTTERTELTWDDAEPFAAAAEIAAALATRGRATDGFDDVLADPARAAEFDKQAARFGGRRVFEHRWTALKLRKEAKAVRRRAEELPHVELRFEVPISAQKPARLRTLPNGPGLFAIFDNEGTRLYVGVASRLRERVGQLLKPQRLRAFDRSCDVRVAVCPAAGSFVDLLALQMRLLAKSPTAFNWCHPADDEARNSRTLPERSTAPNVTPRANRRAGANVERSKPRRAAAVAG